MTPGQVDFCPPSAWPPGLSWPAVGSLLSLPQACFGLWEARVPFCQKWFPAGGRGPRSQGAPSRSEPNSLRCLRWSWSLSHALSTIT